MKAEPNALRTRPHSDRRRQLLTGGVYAAGAALLGGVVPLVRAAPTALKSRRFPFTLGVASGYPTADGFVLWTRLAPLPLAPGGGMAPTEVPVRWEIAGDEHMRHIVRSGTAYATPEWAHSIHVEVADLASGRPYWYRFTAAGAQSPIGRCWTAPAAGARLDRLRLAVASCQQYEQGYYVAYRRMLQDSPDLIVHVGDYIYELSWGDEHVRSHGAGECYTLEDYRIRHALYRTDPDLQAAHAACPWLLTWDDHEVDNDYAGDTSEQDDPPELFRARRAAAYRAYYEHLPLPRRMAPFGPDLRLYTQRSYGDLVNVLLLDERQYRTPQACPLPGQHGSNRVENCAELFGETRTMFGARQEAWLDARLAASKARWNLITQGVVMAYMDELPAPRQRFWTDGWNGYPAARRRLVDSLGSLQVANPVILGGDIHGFVASDLNQVPERPDTPVVCSELVTTSISSQPSGEQLFTNAMAQNPGVKYATGLHRGYLRLDLAPGRLSADLVGMDSVKTRQSGASVLRSYAIEAGQAGLRNA